MNPIGININNPSVRSGSACRPMWSFRFSRFHNLSRLFSGIFIFTFLLASLNVKAQTLSPTVLPTQGAYFTGGGVQLSITIGQPVDTTFIAGGNQLSVGFQQAELNLKTDNVSGASFCVASQISIPFSATDFLGDGNVFTLQLSDLSGSFASPVVLGMDTGMVSDTIVTLIPVNTLAGSHYRMRVVSSYPFYTGGPSGYFSIHALPQAAISPADTTIWTGEPVTLSGMGGVNYTWPALDIETGRVTVTPSADSTYYIALVTDSNGCRDSAKALVVSTDTLLLYVTNYKDTLQWFDSTQFYVSANLPGAAISWERDNTENVLGDTSGSDSVIQVTLINPTRSNQHINFYFSCNYHGHTDNAERSEEQSPQQGPYISVTDLDNVLISTCSDTVIIVDTLYQVNGLDSFSIKQTIPLGAHIVYETSCPYVTFDTATLGNGTTLVTWGVPNDADSLCILLFAFKFDCSNNGTSSNTFTTVLSNDSIDLVSNLVSGASFDLNLTRPMLVETAPSGQPQYTLVGTTLTRIWQVCATNGKVDNITLTYTPGSEINQSGETLVLSTNPSGNVPADTFYVSPGTSTYTISLNSDSLAFLDTVGYLESGTAHACLYIFETLTTSGCSDGTQTPGTFLNASFNCGIGNATCPESSVTDSARVIVQDDWNLTYSADSSPVQLVNVQLFQGDSNVTVVGLAPCSTDFCTIQYTFYNPERSESYLAQDANFKTLTAFVTWINPAWFNTSGMVVKLCDTSGTDCITLTLNTNYYYDNSTGQLSIVFESLNSLAGSILYHGDTVLSEFPYIDSAYNNMNENTKLTISIGGLLFNQNSYYLNACSNYSSSYLMGSGGGCWLTDTTMCGHPETKNYEWGDYSNFMNMQIYGKATPTDVTVGVQDTLSFILQQLTGSANPWVFQDEFRNPFFDCLNPYYEITLSVPDNFTLSTSALYFTASDSTNAVLLHDVSGPDTSVTGYNIYTISDTTITAAGNLIAYVTFNGTDCDSQEYTLTTVGMTLYSICDPVCPNSRYCMGTYQDAIYFHCNGFCSGTGIGTLTFNSTDSQIILHRIPVDSEYAGTGLRNLQESYPCDLIDVIVKGQAYSSAELNADTIFLQLTYNPLAGINQMFDVDSAFYSTDTLNPMWIPDTLGKITGPYLNDSGNWVINVALQGGCDSSLSARFMDSSRVFLMRVVLKVRYDLPGNINNGVYPLQQIRANMSLIDCNDSLHISCDTWGKSMLLIAHQYYEAAQYLDPDNNSDMPYINYTDICTQRLLIETYATGGTGSQEMPNELRPLIVWQSPFTLSGLGSTMHCVGAGFQYPTNTEPFTALCDTCWQQSSDTATFKGIILNGKAGWPQFNYTGGVYFMEMVATFDKTTCANLLQTTDLHFNYWTRGDSSACLSPEQYFASVTPNTPVQTAQTHDSIKLALYNGTNYVWPGATMQPDSTTFTFKAQLQYYGSYLGTGYTWIYPILPPQIDSLKIAHGSLLADTAYYNSGAIYLPPGDSNVTFIASLDSLYLGSGCPQAGYAITFLTGYTCNPDTDNGVPYGIHTPPSISDSSTCGFTGSTMTITIDTPSIKESISSLSANSNKLDLSGSDCDNYSFIYNVEAQNGPVYSPDCHITVPLHVKLDTIRIQLLCNDTSYFTNALSITGSDTTVFNCSTLIQNALANDGHGYLPTGCTLSITAEFTGVNASYGGTDSINFRATGNSLCGAAIPPQIENVQIRFIALDLSIAPHICEGEGYMVAELNGGVSPFTYYWTGPDTFSFISNQDTVQVTDTGQYFITMVDNTGCEATDSLTVVSSTFFSISDSAISLTCAGSANGRIRIISTGGVGPFTYLCISGFVGTDTIAFYSSQQDDTSFIDGLITSWYTVTVTDFMGCRAGATIAVSTPESLTFTPAIHRSCLSDSAGNIRVAISGGTRPYTYLWSTGGTADSVSQLTPGIYEVTVTDSHSCTASDTLTMPGPDTLSLELPTTPVDINCHGDSTGIASITVTNGIPPYTYSWNVPGTDSVIYNLPADTFRVTVTDANNCTATASLILTQPDSAISIIFTLTGINCYGDSTGDVTANVSGGTPGSYTFAWSTGYSSYGGTISTINYVPAGPYKVTVTDVVGCTASSSDTLTQPAPLSIASAIHGTCYAADSGSITITVSGGTPPYNYAWNTGGTLDSITNLYAGIYEVTASDSKGCTASASDTIIEPEALNAGGGEYYPNCDTPNTASISVKVYGGTMPYSFLWSNGETTQSDYNLSPGTYSETITDVNGCQSSGIYGVHSISPIVIYLIEINPACSGDNGAITIQASGGISSFGFDYAWSNVDSAFIFDTSASITNLVSGSYVVTVTQSSGGGADSLPIWTCSASDTFNVDTIVTVFFTATGFDCSGSSTLTASTNLSSPVYDWYDAEYTQSIMIDSSGIYSVTVSGSSGCSASASDTLKKPGPISIAGIIHSTCFDDSAGGIGITVTGGTTPYSYSWSTGDTIDSIAQLPAGTYQVTVTDSRGCTGSANFTLTEPGAISIDVTPTEVDCHDSSTGAIAVMVSGGTPAYSYYWNTGSTGSLITGLAAGTYSLTVTDSTGCHEIDSTTITQSLAISITLSPMTPTCNGAGNGHINTTLSGGRPSYTFVWSNGATTDSITALTAGTYYVTVTDSLGCTKTDAATITQPAVLTILSTYPDSICEGETGYINDSITGGTLPYQYLWNNGDTSRNRTGLDSGIYVLTVTDANGCTAARTDTIGTMPAYRCCFTNPDSTIIPINANTNTSALHIPPGSEVYVAPGVILTVDNNDTLLNCQVVLGNYSVIEVDAGDTLNILGSTLKGCDTMWFAIFAYSNSGLIVDSANGARSVIEDAIAGIVAEDDPGGSMKLMVSNTDFYKNEYGIDLYNFLPPSNTAYNISNCYFGMGNYTSMLPAPAGFPNYNRPVAGIEVQWPAPPDGPTTFDTVRIPNPGLSGKPNTFQYMNMGIYVANSMVNVYTNTFDGIRNYEAVSPTGFFGAAVAGFGVAVNQYSPPYGSLIVQTSDSVSDSLSAIHFNNCDYGIKELYCGLSAQNNRMENVSYGVYAGFTNSQITIQNNYINNTSYGISLLNNSSAKQLVYNNTMYINPPVAEFEYVPVVISLSGRIGAHIFTILNTYGVYESEVTSSKTTISTNHIYNGRNCIWLNNTYGTWVYNNTLYQNSTVAVYGPQAGIYAANCKSLTVSDNQCYGDSDFYNGTPEIITSFGEGVSTRHRSGITLYNSATGTICGNVVGGSSHSTGLGYGMLFASYCYHLAVHINTMNRSSFGITLQSSGIASVLSNQGSLYAGQGNSFTGDGSGNFLSGYRTGSYINTDSFYVQPIFYYKSSQPLTNPLPEPDSGFALINGIFKALYAIRGFQTVGTGDFYYFCPETITFGYKLLMHNIQYMDTIIAQNNIKYYMEPEYETTGPWLASKILYESLYNDTAVLNNDSLLNAFYTKEDSSDLGTILQSELQNNLLTDSATLAGGGTIGTAGASAYSAALATAVSLNDAVPDSNLQATNYKAMSGIYLQTLAAGIDTFTSGQLDTITNLAVQCPYTAGDAVYMARSLYAQYDNTIFFDDIAICEPALIDSFRMLRANAPDTTKPNTSSPLADFVQVYPNPTKQLINLFYNAKTIGIVEFDLLDPLGQPVLKHILGQAQNFAQYTTGNLSSGLYYWQLKDSERTIKVGKIVIIK